MEVIDELCSFQGRRAGTDAERRAASWLAKRVRDGGRRVVVEPIYVHPQYGLVQALHCALGFAGSLVAPFRVLFWSLAILLPILGARMAGVDSGLISLLQLIPTLILLIGVFLLADIELSDVVPGANDNASGVATALSLAEELDAEAP